MTDPKITDPKITDIVTTERHGKVLEIIFNRPPVNAINRAASQALYDAFATLRDDDGLAVGIVTAAASVVIVLPLLAVESRGSMDGCARRRPELGTHLRWGVDDLATTIRDTPQDLQTAESADICSSRSSTGAAAPAPC